MNSFSHFVICGQDGDIHIYSIDPTDDNVEHIRCADQCSSIVVHVSNNNNDEFFLLIIDVMNKKKENHLFVGTNRNELEVRSYPHGDSLPSLMYFTQPVSTLALFNSIIFVGTRFLSFSVPLFHSHDHFLLHLEISK